MSKEVKACRTPYPLCDRSLPADSKHEYCPRCRNYDRHVAAKPPSWQTHRLNEVSRWRGFLAEVVPKKDRVVVERATSNIHKFEARKRA